MDTKTLVSMAVLAVVASANAAPIGNNLGIRTNPDVNAFVFVLANNSPLTGAGTINSLSIYSGYASGNVTFALLHNVSGSIYTVVATDTFALTGTGLNTDAVNWTASAGDVFAVHGLGPTFDYTNTPAAGDQLNSTFISVAPTVSSNWDFSTATVAYPGQNARVYSLQADFTPVPEPSTLAFSAFGAVAFLARRRKKAN